MSRKKFFLVTIAILSFVVIFYIFSEKDPEYPAIGRQIKNKMPVIPFDFIKECGLNKELQALLLSVDRETSGVNLFTPKFCYEIWEKPVKEANPGFQVGKNGFSVELCNSQHCTGFFFKNSKL